MKWKSLTVGTILVVATSVLSAIDVFAKNNTPKLKINRIAVFDRQDTGGNGRADEPYLEVNGNIIWSDKIVGTGARNLDLEIPFNSNMAKIVLWERDGADFRGSTDDRLGSVRVYATQIGFGQQKVVFQDRDKGYHYEIYYQVN
ncbi:MAG: hypothetical protein ACFBSE_05130 [Prochloraceae cyanobacterium]